MSSVPSVDPDSNGVVALAQLDTGVETTTGSQAKVDAHKIVTSSVHNFDASGNAPPQAHNHDASYLVITSFSGLAKISVSATAPSSPGVGDLWVDTS